MVVSPSSPNLDLLTRPADAIEKTPAVTWWKDFETNVRGTFLVTAGFLKLIKESKAPDPTIVTLTSLIDGAPPLFSSYFTSKITLVKFTEFVAAENPEVATYSITPGTSPTDMTLDAFRPFSKDTRKHKPVPLKLPPPPFILKIHAVNQLCISIAELTGAVTVYLAARRPMYLTGQHLSVNWDVEELEQRRDEFGTTDALKLRILKPQQTS